MAQKYWHFNADYHNNLKQWHESLYSHKGDRAALKRCTKPDDVILSAGFRSIYQKLFGFKQATDNQLIALACVAGVLAHVKEHDEKAPTFASQMAMAKPGTDKPRVSEMRLNQLLRSYSWDEFYRGLIRMVRMLDDKLDVISLAEAVFHWGKEFNGEFAKQPTKRLQVKWATEYYKVLFKDNSKPNSKD